MDIEDRDLFEGYSLGFEVQILGKTTTQITIATQVDLNQVPSDCNYGALNTDHSGWHKRIEQKMEH
jgi:hypothetical protein